MKILLTLLLIASICGLFKSTKVSRVYTCNDVSAYQYHYKKDCNRLSHCGDIKEISRDSAIKSYGLLPCPECVTDTN